MNFVRVRKVNLPQQITSMLREMIIGGEVRAGERLPPERELARRFGTNRNTLREALKVLERDGLIVIREGGGIEVTDFYKEGKINLLSAIIRNTKDLGMKINIVLDALRVRSAGLAEIARIAAEKGKKSQIGLVKDILEKMKENIGTKDHQKAYELEMQFLKAVVEASNSYVLIWFFNTIREIMKDAFEEFSELWGIGEDYYRSVSRIYAAIEKGDSERAYRVTREHFDNLDKKLIKLFKEVRAAQI